MTFTHLHVRTAFSAHYGVARPEALVAAAAIISTGRTPKDHRGELTSDELLSTARQRATELLSTHADDLSSAAARRTGRWLSRPAGSGVRAACR